MLVDVLSGTGEKIHDVLPVSVELVPPMGEDENGGVHCLVPCGNPFRLVGDSLGWCRGPK